MVLDLQVEAAGDAQRRRLPIGGRVQLVGAPIDAGDVRDALGTLEEVRGVEGDLRRAGSTQRPLG